jgi:hypothetical protein
MVCIFYYILLNFEGGGGGEGRGEEGGEGGGEGAKCINEYLMQAWHCVGIKALV